MIIKVQGSEVYNIDEGKLRVGKKVVLKDGREGKLAGIDERPYPETNLLKIEINED